MKTPPAARRLLKEVQERYPEARVTLLDEDGLGFYRSVRFDPRTSHGIYRALRIVGESDPRIKEVVSSPHGVRVTFVPTTVADRADEFMLGQVLDVLEEA